MAEPRTVRERILTGLAWLVLPLFVLLLLPLVLLFVVWFYLSALVMGLVALIYYLLTGSRPEKPPLQPQIRQTRM